VFGNSLVKIEHSNQSDSEMPHFMNCSVHLLTKIMLSQQY